MLWHTFKNSQIDIKYMKYTCILFVEIESIDLNYLKYIFSFVRILVLLCFCLTSIILLSYLRNNLILIILVTGNLPIFIFVSLIQITDSAHLPVHTPTIKRKEYHNRILFPTQVLDLVINLAGPWKMRISSFWSLTPPSLPLPFPPSLSPFLPSFFSSFFLGDFWLNIVDSKMPTLLLSNETC